MNLYIIKYERANMNPREEYVAEESIIKAAELFNENSKNCDIVEIQFVDKILIKGEKNAKI